MTVTLKELAEAIGAELGGDPGVVISGVGSLEDAVPGQVTFLANPKYLKELESTRASAVIVAPSVKIDHLPLLRAKDPYYAFALAVRHLHGERKHPFTGVHPRATVDSSASLGPGTVVYPGAYIGPRVRIGRDCVLHANVVVYEDCVIGDRVIIHANTSIGPDGFGFATSNGLHHKIPQIGNVVIEDDVEIGANCAIDRAALGSTVIGKGSKLNDLIAIGHNTKMGPHCLIVSQVGIAGSATIGHHVTLAGQVGVAGHIEVGDNVTVGAQAGVTNSVAEQSILLGSPAMPIRQARRVAAVFVQLPELQDRVKKLEQAVEELAKDDEPGA